MKAKRSEKTLKEAVEDLKRDIKGSSEDPEKIRCILSNSEMVANILRAELGHFRRLKPRRRFVLNTKCAAKLSSDWILARIIKYEPERQTVTVRDVDESDKKIFVLSEDNVEPLDTGRIPNWSKLSPGNLVLALYPDTTTFYPGTIAQEFLEDSSFAIKFDGDETNEFGDLVTKKVSMAFIARKLI